MYAVYSIDGGTTWQGTTYIDLSNNQAGYRPLSIDYKQQFSFLHMETFPSRMTDYRKREVISDK